MKKVTHLAAAAMVALTFGFASCDSKTAENAENTAESAADEISTEADETFSSTDTVSVKDEPVKDGVADRADSIK
ncbi:hypothetical protein [Rufibacter sp. LB8]|uniref:hypothetical protein n=1 Tax=Rufibacter sp. LB8 TaxID=2777781 RepID=UPI00178C548E|nr:hypothetical protein [Rufibacter sp. LB8]